MLKLLAKLVTRYQSIKKLFVITLQKKHGTTIDIPNFTSVDNIIREEFSLEAKPAVIRNYTNHNSSQKEANPVPDSSKQIKCDVGGYINVGFILSELKEYNPLLKPDTDNYIGISRLSEEEFRVVSKMIVNANYNNVKRRSAI